MYVCLSGMTSEDVCMYVCMSGMTREDVDSFAHKLDKAFAKFMKKHSALHSSSGGVAQHKEGAGLEQSREVGLEEPRAVASCPEASNEGELQAVVNRTDESGKEPNESN